MVLVPPTSPFWTWIRLIMACSSLFNILLKPTLAHVSWRSPLKASLNILALNLVTWLTGTMDPLVLGLHQFWSMCLQLWVIYLCYFYNGSFVTNLVFGGFGGFPNLDTKELVYGLLILRETWPTFEKNPLRRLEVWTHKKILVVLRNGCHSH